jgi:hypothetical protein
MQVLDNDERLLAHGMPCEDFGFTIPEKLLHPTGMPRYIRPGGLPGATDIREYDVGNLFVSTSGVSDNTTKLGELHVAYEVEFSVPVLESTTSPPVNNTTTWFISSSAESFTNGTGKQFALATTEVNGLVIVNTAGSMVPPVGNYLVDFWINAMDTSNEVFTARMDFQKNGSTIFPSANINAVQSPATASPQLNIASSAYVVANGTDTFDLRGTLVGSAGTLTATGSVRWTAV